MEICGRDGRSSRRGSNKRMECKGRPKWRDAPLTKKAPYKPDARIGLVRICAGVLSNEHPYREPGSFATGSSREQARPSPLCPESGAEHERLRDGLLRVEGTA